MTETTSAPVVRRQIVVDAPLEKAFETFTERFGDFKPKEHNIMASPIAETVFEPRVGGHILDRAEDGTECRWARILAYDPPDRVVFSWDIGPDWQLVTDPASNPARTVGQLRIAPGYKPTPDARFDLTVLYDSGTPKLYADYNIDLYDASTVEDLLHHMAAVMRTFTQPPSAEGLRQICWS